MRPSLLLSGECTLGCSLEPFRMGQPLLLLRPMVALLPAAQPPGLPLPRRPRLQPARPLPLPAAPPLPLLELHLLTPPWQAAQPVLQAPLQAAQLLPVPLLPLR